MFNFSYLKRNVNKLIVCEVGVCGLKIIIIFVFKIFGFY